MRKKGQTLRSVMKSNKGNLAAFLDMVVQVTRLIYKLHSIDVIHGDLHVDNIMADEISCAKEQEKAGLSHCYRFFLIDFGEAVLSHRASLRQDELDAFQENFLGLIRSLNLLSREQRKLLVAFWSRQIQLMDDSSLHEHLEELQAFIH